MTPFKFKDFKINDHASAISAIAYGLMAYFVGVYGFQIYHGGNGWKTADWLINFQGGPVRRGLSGEALYWVYRSGFPLLWATFCLQVLIYASIAFYSLKLLFAVERKSAWLLFVFSPAFVFLFPAYDLQGGFRKEIIVFLSYSLMAVGLLGEKPNQKYLAASFIVFFIAVFSHELTAFCLPFFVYLLFVRMIKTNQHPRQGWVYVASFSLVASLGLVFAAVHAGTPDSASAICASLVQAGIKADLCGGAILRLSYDSTDAIHGVAKHLLTYAWVYPLLWMLAVLPLTLTSWGKPGLVLLVPAFVVMLPLFVIAGDWGRWLHIYFFMAFITILLESSKSTIRMRSVPLLAIVLYAALWSIPHCCASRPGWGVLDVLTKLHRTSVSEAAS